MDPVYIGENDLSIEQFINISKYNAIVKLDSQAILKIKASRKAVENIVQSCKPVYGINTGFGAHSEINVTSEDCVILQEKLILSHAVGVGDSFSEEVVRGMMLLLVNSLAKGFSGVRLVLVETLINMLNKGVHPIVPQKGSLGASGDLVPMSHIILVLLGYGSAKFDGIVMPGAEAMDKAGVPIITLVEKEGLSCINGTYAMTSLTVLLIHYTKFLLKAADISCALTFEALNGITVSLDPKVHNLRPHKGQQDTGVNLLQLLNGSGMVSLKNPYKRQDAYSLRCAPQVHGASKDAYCHTKKIVEIEMNSVTDNPIIIANDDCSYVTGNFHGQPIALAVDYLCMAIAELANIAERRIERLVNPALSGGLPGFLTKHNGINSGMMIVQYVTASLVSENKVLSHPASVDSIPCSANQEDHVSMGTIGARKAHEVLLNARTVIAMELLCACQGIDLRQDRRLGKGTEAAYRCVREKVEYLDLDRVMHKDIFWCGELITKGQLITQVEDACGPLKI